MAVSTTPLSLSEDRENLSPVPATQYHPFRPAALGLLSALIPGIGHLIIRCRAESVLLLMLFVALLTGFWPFRVLRYYDGFLGLFGGWVVLGIYATCSAFVSARDVKSERPSKWWLVLLAPAGFAILSLTGSGVTRLTGFRSFLIPSTGMDPTIRQGDRIVADMQFYRKRSPNRLETILFKRGDIFYIKRVIAVGGDIIEGKDQVIFVNRKKLYEPYVEHTGEAPTWANTFGPIPVPDGRFFVMGDNRDYSLDSRSEEYGFVERESIAGKPVYIFASDQTGKSIQ